MPTQLPQAVQDALNSVDQATTAVGDRIAKITSQITAGMSPEQVASVVDALNAESEKLRAMSIDTSAPEPLPADGNTTGA